MTRRRDRRDPTRRDEAWHAVFVTATRTERAFDVHDVAETADSLGFDVAKRTLRYALQVMADLGYLDVTDSGDYELGDVTDAVEQPAIQNDPEKGVNSS